MKFVTFFLCFSIASTLLVNAASSSSSSCPNAALAILPPIRVVSNPNKPDTVIPTQAHRESETTLGNS